MDFHFPTFWFYMNGFCFFVLTVGGIMGFAKTGSSKSLMAGGGSALILYYVFLNLPTKPIMSSIIGLGKLDLHLVILH